MDDVSIQKLVALEEWRAENLAHEFILHGMLVENAMRLSRDESPAYGKDAFIEVRDEIMRNNNYMVNKIRDIH